MLHHARIVRELQRATLRIHIFASISVDEHDGLEYAS